MNVKGLVVCPYCDQDAELVRGAMIYPTWGKLKNEWFWRCAPCQAWVGTHQHDPNHQPLGTLANLDLRYWRQRAHAAFDPLWKGIGAPMTRKTAYAWLSGATGWEVTQCHIAHLQEAGCKAVIRVCRQRHKMQPT